MTTEPTQPAGGGDAATIHATTARDLLRPPVRFYNDGQTREEHLPTPERTNQALTHATLALVEEQRTANLIARAALSIQVGVSPVRPTTELAQFIDHTIDERMGL